MFRDLKLAQRALLRQPAFALVTILLVAMGIGGATAIFSLVNGLFLRPLPLHRADRLVDLDERAPKWNLERVSVSGPDFLDWRDGQRTFERLAVYDNQGFNLSTGRAAERVEGHAVDAEMDDVLRIQPALGRTFTPDEARPGGGKVILLGYELWSRLYGGRDDALGERVLLDGQPYTIVGVLPHDLAFPDRSAFWVPLQVDLARPQGWFLAAIGRLKDGVSVEQARADLLRVHAAPEAAKKPGRDVTEPLVTPLRDRAVGDYSLSAQLLFGAVLVVLLIACVNVSALMLVRGMGRAREMGIRAALGASRTRLVRQLLVESLLIAGIGGVAGALLGSIAVRGLVSLMPDQLPRWTRFDADLRFLLFAILLSACAAVLFGLWPAIAASRTDLRGILHERATRTTASAGGARGLKALVIGEVMLAAALLIASGLLLQALRNVQQVEAGFRAENLLTYAVNLPGRTYGEEPRRAAFYRQLVEQTRPLPGVTAAGATSDTPLGSHWGNFFEVDGATARTKDAPSPVVLVRVVTPGYLETLGATLLRGRLFDAKDDLADARTVIVNERFAAQHWPGANPLGKRIRPGGGKVWLTVVGLLRDVKDYGLDQPARPSVYMTHGSLPIGRMTMVVRSSTEPEALVAPSRALLARLDPDLAMFQVLTMRERLEESMWVRRGYSVLVTAFGLVALVLATAGVAGVVWSSVTARTREIGVRMALGAQRGQVLRAVLMQGVRLTMAGVVLGVAGGYAGARLLRSVLFGVDPSAPAVYVAVAVLLALLALLANLLPARKAARVDPMAALRAD